MEDLTTKYGKLKKKVNYKPIFPLVVIIALGVLLISVRNAFGYFVGGFFVALGLLAITTKDRKVAELYEQGLVVFDKEEKPLIDFPYSEIKEWNMGMEQANAIWFKLQSGREITISSLNLNGANQFLRKRFLDKETKTIKEKEASFAGRLTNPFTGLFARSKNEFSDTSAIKETVKKKASAKKNAISSEDVVKEEKPKVKKVASKKPVAKKTVKKVTEAKKETKKPVKKETKKTVKKATSKKPVAKKTSTKKK